MFFFFLVVLATRGPETYVDRSPSLFFFFALYRPGANGYLVVVEHTNFHAYDANICTSWTSEMVVCRYLSGGCGVGDRVKKIDN